MDGRPPGAVLPPCHGRRDRRPVHFGHAQLCRRTGSMTLALESPVPPKRNDLYVLMALTPLLLGALLVIRFIPEQAAATMMTQLFVALLLVLASFDLASWRVPNLLVYPFIAFAILGTALVDLSLVDDALLGGVASLALMFVIALIGR